MFTQNNSKTHQSNTTLKTDVISYNYMFRYMLRHHQNLYRTLNTRQYFKFFPLYFSEIT